ncbi:cytochrome c-type biogenesis protein CcmH/NrfG [Parabacteroides sp. PF5-5]|uniref:hypothetical protein n=1 Tax=unclassified Parabacteroides TaxID=2649774 RepID=UPI00247410BE|nr:MULTISPECIES: hypothetical protein [unclassified Parabacteroides]MDH6304350.1 cytochrome c-type biogenesis protein CcmH/NrfG [Parabacteroides sp. PH5-39]MDH6315497.1 cytochrome c-type biogenesis protein CcmH/NrfG [Parabacteroides sp. PF5-13]MDH6319009.1 cytochrome c-type biogenesis protein CcmH/NrfG [Parabacteroides sp. PH5-13]MDH6322738.1 cytochrome c-type biogenesis protein CcmH/NrfG [Parabacteroides sp. PH5-8]MDH6326690.1 cytochrome c-type biogenesis protein CcmH/NrfG [Parabacteroides sp
MKNVVWFVFFIFSACSVGRESRLAYQRDVREEVMLSDSFIRQHVYSGLQHKKVAIRQVWLSPPDTSNKQYVQAITEIASVDEQTYQGEETVEKERSLHQSIESKDESQSLEKKRISKNTPLCLFLLLGGLIASILSYVKGK